MTKKICHLLIAYGNKNQNYTSRLLEGLSENSTDMHFVFCHYNFSRPQKTKVVISHSYSLFNAILKSIKHYTNSASFRSLVKEVGLKEILKWIWLIDYKIDVLHVHHEHAISLPILKYFKSIETKIIISLRGKDLLVNSKQPENFKALQLKLSQASNIHCISNYMAKELHKTYNMTSNIVYRGLPDPIAINIKRKNLPTNVIKIIAVGRLAWEKGHIYIIESAYRLKALGYTIQLDIYGDGKLKEFLTFRVKQLHLENEISLKGFVDNETLRSKYKNYDMAVQPSLYEALSNGLIDFVFHNIPCVISNVGGMTEVIEHDKNGFVFDNKNMQLLDKAILQTKNINFQKVVAYNEQHNSKFSSQKEINGLLGLYLQ
ncbi:glycosyltransferase [Xanthomarina sp. F1114]|uniref:glycosyltransferase n=1 Tax=Xanthomarina sp. F1114 TaxID=2996019 RepID=UPI00225E5759|nr:glycosyltransferase [Xanthomarina sp. F1114]MCX7549056.1 glycosyltransferase [Xanthomarina sp. F1114]